MSSMQVGKRLLAEVETLSLDKLLTSLRKSHDNYQGAATHVAELDRLLEIILRPLILSEHQQSELPLLNAEYSDNGHLDVPGRTTHTPTAQSSDRERPTLIEISAGEARPEATDFCYFLTAASILPRITGGKECCVVWLDTETKFSATRLYQVCLNYQDHQSGDLKPREREYAAREALKHVHIFPVQSSKQLLSVLHSLPAYLFGHTQDTSSTITLPEHYSAHRCLSLIVLDSATAFYWSDRFDMEIAQLESKEPSRSSSASETNTPLILTQLKSLHAQFDCSVVYTTDNSAVQLHARNYSRQSTPVPGHKTVNVSEQDPNHHQSPAALPPPDDASLPSISQWTTSCTLSLHLSSIPAPQFAAYMSIEECLRDRDKRAEIVRKNRVKVSVNKVWLERVVRDADVKSALKALNAKGGFVMNCTSTGVDIER